jgi:hypothetical protein
MINKGLHKYTVQESQNIGIGQAGSILVTGTTAVTPKIGVVVAITFLEDTKFTNDATGLVAESQQLFPDSVGTGRDIDADGGGATSTEEFPKGVTIYGRWTSFALAEGKVIAYIG